MNSKDTRIVFMISFVFLGILLSVQFKSILTINRQKLSVQKQIVLYKEQLENEKEKTKYLMEQIKNEEKSKENILNELINNQNDKYLAMKKENLDRARFLAGLTDVKGAGIIIKLDDAPARNLQDPEENPNDLIIHDSDVIGVLNELKKSGAQALSINDERVVSLSEQVCAGPNILINNKRYPVPYTIKAIGDADMLYNNLNESDIIYILKSYKIRVEISKSDDIVIPKYEYLQHDGQRRVESK